MGLGERIRQARIEAGLTQRDLGHLVGASFTHISKIEAEKEVPGTDLLILVAKAVNIDPDELLLLAQRVPADLRQVVLDKRDLAPRFLREWREGRISDQDVERLLQRRSSDASGARPTFPRSRERHEKKATDILNQYARKTKWKPQLPVPVERIVELLGLKILWRPIKERDGLRILGALDPALRTIELNENHLATFQDVIGPESFTLAHELGHWLYDAENPDQLGLLSDSDQRIFCRGLRYVELTDNERIREINANRFASCLLLPREFIATQLTTSFSSLSSLREAARVWGVSRRMLEIRLRELGRDDLLPAELV